MYSSKIRYLADTTTRQFNSHLSDASETVAKVSSGKRSPSPKYDVVSLAISNKMSSDIAALNQGIRNLSQGSAVLNIAANGIDQITEVMTRMKTLAVQASTDVLGSSEREYANEEFQKLSGTIDSLIGTVRFAGNELLAGGEVKGAIGGGKSFVSAAPEFGRAADANSFFDLYKTQSSPLSGGYVRFNSATQDTVVSRNDKGTLYVTLGDQTFEVDPSDVAAGQALTFRDISEGDNYFSLQLKDDVSAIDTASELTVKLRDFFGNDDTGIYVGTQTPLSSGWSRIEYDGDIADNDALWNGQAGQWTRALARTYITADTLKTSPQMTGLSGDIEEVYVTSAGAAGAQTFAISIKVDNEIFLSTVDSYNSEVLTDLNGGGAINHKIKFRSLENETREISFELTAGVRSALTDHVLGQANPPSLDDLNAAIGEGVGFALGTSLLTVGGAARDPAVAHNNINNIVIGLRPSISRFSQTGGNDQSGARVDAPGFYTNFNVAPENPGDPVQSIGNQFLLNTARTIGNIDGMAESVKVTRPSSSGGGFNVDVVIGGRTFIARGFRPIDQAITTTNSVNHGSAADLQISSTGYLDQSATQTLDLVDARNPSNRISLNLSHDAATQLKNESILQSSIEQLFGVGLSGDAFTTAHFSSGRAVHDGVNGFVAGGANSSVVSYPGADEGLYFVSYDATEKTFNMSGNGENWSVPLSGEDKIRNIVDFGNGIALDLGRAGNEFDPTVSMGQFAIEIKHDGIKTFEYQTGGSVEDTISFKLGGLSAKGLRVNDLNVLSKDAAREAQRIIDGAISGMNSIMTDLGSQQSFTEIAISNSTNVSIWSQEARSGFADSDIADELVRFNKETVLTQAAASMVTQAQQMFAQLQDILR